MSHLKQLKKDPLLKNILPAKATMVLVKEKNLYLYVCYSIISQQLSTKAAQVIRQRFLMLFNNKKPSLNMIASLPYNTLKGIGLSHAKTNYVFNVCHFFIENKLTDTKIHKMSDEEIIDMLTKIKGVGKWTVEMILMFALGREDVFSADDLGIQKQMSKLYSINSETKKELKNKMEKIAESWRPYRTYACRYLWQWKDLPKK